MKKMAMFVIILVLLAIFGNIGVYANTLELNNAIFFKADAVSDKQFIMSFACNPRTQTDKLGDYTITGMAEDTKGADLRNDFVVIFYVESIKNGEPAFEPLYILDEQSGKDNEISEPVNYGVSSVLFCENVMLNFAKDQLEQKIRIVVYRKSNSEKLELNQNLQITDMMVKKEQPKGILRKITNTIEDMKEFIGSKFDGNK